MWNYCNVYFRELGFGGQEIGLMSAGGTLLTMAFLPLLGVLGDKLQSPRRVFAWLIRFLFPLYLLLPVFGLLWGASVVPFVMLASLILFGVAASNSMMDSWSGSELGRIGVSFGAVRWRGSFAAVIIGLTASRVIGPILPAWSCCVIIPILSIPLFFLAERKDMETASVQVKQEKMMSSAELLKLVFKNYYFVVYLLMYLAFSAFVSTVNLSMSYLMDYAGAPRSSVGVISSTRAAAEIVVMVWLVHSKKRPANWVLLAVANLMIALEYLIYPGMTSLGLMVAACLLSGLGGGLFYGVGINHVLQIVDHRATSTAVSIMGMCNAAVGIIGAMAGGMVIDRYGILTMTNAIGLLSLALTSVFMVLSFLGRVVWKKPYVNEKEAV